MPFADRPADAEAALTEAIDELYGAALDRFLPLRTELVARARARGDRAAAKQIAGLRKPTRSAGLINQLVRRDPSVVDQLTDLAERLRAAERALDGAGMRALTTEKNRLVAGLTRAAGRVDAPSGLSAAVSEEVSGTLAAALADPAVATDLAAGRLIRAASWSGFGIAPPDLTLVRAPAGKPTKAEPRTTEPRKPEPRKPEPAATEDPARAKPDAPVEPAAREDAGQAQALAARAARERDRQQERDRRRDEAGTELERADDELRASTAAQKAAGAEVTRLTGELTRARSELAATTRSVTAARSRQRQARQALRTLRS